jgi:hypothetical protein
MRYIALVVLLHSVTYSYAYTDERSGEPKVTQAEVDAILTEITSEQQDAKLEQEIEATTEILDNNDFFDEIDSYMDEKEHEKRMQQIREEQPPSFLMVNLRYIGVTLALKYIALRGYVGATYSALTARLKNLLSPQKSS